MYLLFVRAILPKTFERNSATQSRHRQLIIDDIAETHIHATGFLADNRPHTKLLESPGKRTGRRECMMTYQQIYTAFVMTFFFGERRNKISF